MQGLMTLLMNEGFHFDFLLYELQKPLFNSSNIQNDIGD